ncbi:DNA repair and recombination protein Rdh54p [[Candida] jaroonii]|uniref:DNA repair and recombination protein Rdh54p n=1 Tax=[Candida] jaroonii TaxID=467808 RepID=A0ACA9Y612_9ASCO|nr:DNA repair and recombination protein Rdh54p [[Candida] jaroonii]
MRSISAPFKPPRFVRQSQSDQGSGEEEKEDVEISSSPPKSTSRSKKTAPTRIYAPISKQVDSQPSQPSQDVPELRQVSGKKYVVQYRKVTNKKNKTWDGDGTLEISDQMVLKIDKRRIVRPLSKIDGIIKFGGFEVEIDYEVESSDQPTQESQPKPLLRGPSRAKRPFTKLTTNVPVSEEKKSKQGPLYPIEEDSFIMKSLSPDHKPVIIDPSLSKHLRPHQREGVSFLYEGVMGFNDTTGVLLADEMGLGKTLMTITLIWTLLKQSPLPNVKSVGSKVLIVCPVTLINNWKKEFKKWINLNQLGILVLDSNTKSDLKNFKSTRVYQILIMSYEKLHNCENELQEVSFDLLICDEGHKLKNTNNKSLKILKSLDIEKKVLLSGTPIQNNLNEFFTLVDFINPGVLGSFNQFQKNYIRPIEQSRDVNCYNQEILLKGEEVSNQLSELTSKFILRRTNEVLSKYLGEKTDLLVFVKPTSFQLQLFKQISSSVTYTTENALNMINLYKKICNSPKLVNGDNLFTSLDLSMKELPVASGKINLLIALMIEIHEKKEKLVLISNYTKTLDLFASICSKLNYGFLRLDGSTTSAMRSSVISQFNNTKFPQFPVFLLSSKSGGFGINLIGASRLILFDNDWNPATDLQSMSRIYRDGQTRPVFIYRLFTTGCIDEKIFQRQLMKTNLSDAFLDNGSSSNVFGMDDLKDLFTVVDTDCNTHDLLECPCTGDGENMDVIASASSEPRSEISLGSDWISAKDFQETPSKKSIQLALNDYRHLKDNYHDDILDKVKKNGISYVFTKVTNNDNKENLSQE